MIWRDFETWFLDESISQQNFRITICYTENSHVQFEGRIIKVIETNSFIMLGLSRNDSGRIYYINPNKLILEEI